MALSGRDASREIAMGCVGKGVPVDGRPIYADSGEAEEAETGEIVVRRKGRCACADVRTTLR
jgi:hypothetical protein